MIIDTTYLLPLSRISIDTDLLRAIAENKIAVVGLEDLGVSSISIFEIQAKAAKLKIKPEYVSEAVSSISDNFRVEPFYAPTIIESSFELKSIFSDYIDCIIVGTAVSLKEDLITEDSKILDRKDILHDKFGVNVSSYATLTK